MVAGLTWLQVLYEARFHLKPFFPCNLIDSDAHRELEVGFVHKTIGIFLFSIFHFENLTSRQDIGMSLYPYVARVPRYLCTKHKIRLAVAVLGF